VQGFHWSYDTHLGERGFPRPRTLTVRCDVGTQSLHGARPLQPSSKVRLTSPTLSAQGSRNPSLFPQQAGRNTRPRDSPLFRSRARVRKMSGRISFFITNLDGEWREGGPLLSRAIPSGPLIACHRKMSAQSPFGQLPRRTGCFSSLAVVSPPQRRSRSNSVALLFCVP
jgi:hypothetical protein